MDPAVGVDRRVVVAAAQHEDAGLHPLKRTRAALRGALLEPAVAAHEAVVRGRERPQVDGDDPARRGDESLAPVGRDREARLRVVLDGRGLALVEGVPPDRHAVERDRPHGAVGAHDGEARGPDAALRPEEQDEHAVAVGEAVDPAVERLRADHRPGSRVDGDEGGRLTIEVAVLSPRQPRPHHVEMLCVRPEGGADQRVPAGVEDREAAHRACVDEHERRRDRVVGQHELRPVGRVAPGARPGAELNRAPRPPAERQRVEPDELRRILAGGDEAEERRLRGLLRRPAAGDGQERGEGDQQKRGANPSHPRRIRCHRRGGSTTAATRP